MLEKFAGYKTQIRVLEKKLKEMDHAKLSPAKVKEVTEAIQNLKTLVKEKEDKREERKRKKQESSEAPKAEAAVVPTEVVKESAPIPTEVTKESDTTHFAVDSKVEPMRGTPGSWGTVIRSSGTNGDPLCYVKWAEGTIKSREEYGAYYESDLRMKVEKEAVNTDYVPREQLYHLESDLKSSYERMIADLQEEIQTAKDKAEYAWVGRLEGKLADIQKAYQERFEKTADRMARCPSCSNADMNAPENKPWTCPSCGTVVPVEKKAEDENGSGGTNKLKVYDQNPPYDKDPQEKATGYGGDRPMGAMVAPNSDENSLPLESKLKEAGATVGWNVYLNGKKIDKVFYTPSTTAEEVKKGLVEHDNYDSGITVKKEASLKFADMDLNSIDKRYAIYLKDVSYPAVRTLTRSKAERIAKEKFPEQMAAGKVEIKREDFKEASLNVKADEDAQERAFERAVDRLDKKLMKGEMRQAEYDAEYAKLKKEMFPKEVSLYRDANLNKQAINITIAEKLFVVNPLGKTAEEEYHYDVALANGSKLFKITSKDEMGQEHLSYVIEKELMNHKEASNKCVFCGQEFASWPEYDAHKKEEHKPKMDPAQKQEIVDRVEKKTPGIIGRLTSNLAFLKKGSLVSIIAVDNNKKQIKFAALDNSLRGWAPMQKFSALNAPEAHLIDHEGHKDEVLADNGGKEILVTCPANSVNVEWRTVEAPPATPESLNPDVASLKKANEEMPENEQSEEDIYIQDDRGDTIAASPAHGVIAKLSTFNGDWELFYTQIRDWMESNNFFPSVWTVSDHGNVNIDTDWIAHVNKFPLKNASLNKNAHIRHEDGKWVIYSHDYKKKLGTYDSKEAAEKRLRQIEYFKHQGSLQPLSKKEANVMETKCEGCGKELGPEVFLSKHPVCGKCTKKRHEKAVGKKADQEVSLEQQVQSFKDRMSAVTERLSNPPAKTASEVEETSKGEDAITTSELIESLERGIDLLEGKTSDQLTPEQHHNLEEMENLLWKVEDSLGLSHPLPEHETKEPEHAKETKVREEEFKAPEVEKDSNLEVKAEDVNTPPPALPPVGFRYAWDPKNMTWILVQITGAPGGGV